MRLSSRDHRTSTRLPFAIRAFFTITAFLWFASIASCVVTGLRTGDWDAAFRPISFPFPFMDLFCYVRRFQYLHQLAFFAPYGSDLPWTYPAPCALLYALLYKFLPYRLNPETLNLASDTYLLNPLTLSVLPLLLLTLAIFTRALKQSGLEGRRALLVAAALAALSWPLFFALQRGNLDALLWFPLLAGVWAMHRQRYFAGALLIGIASAFKLYPVALLALLLPQRHYRAFLCGAAAFLLTSVAALIWLGPTLPIAYASTQLGIAHFASQYTLRYDPLAMGYDHSLFSCLKALMPSAPFETLAKANHAYLLIAGSSSVIVFFTVIARRPWINQLLYVTAMTLLLPATSFDYSLLGLYAPVASLLLLSLRSNPQHRSRPLLAALILCAILLAPETFVSFGGRVIAGQIKALCLLSLGLFALFAPFAEPQDDLVHYAHA